jgi:hypothetical protein
MPNQKPPKWPAVFVGCLVTAITIYSFYVLGRVATAGVNPKPGFSLSLYRRARMHYDLRASEMRCSGYVFSAGATNICYAEFLKIPAGPVPTGEMHVGVDILHRDGWGQLCRWSASGAWSYSCIPRYVGDRTQKPGVGVTLQAPGAR